MSEDAPAVLVERRGFVQLVTINRPEARNAVNLAVAQGIAAAMEELDASDELRVGVLTGAGGVFCSGMDLKAFLKGEVPHVEGRGFGGLTTTPPRKPLIAAVEGYALAGGCELMLACDLVIAGESARFGTPEVGRGLVAAAGAAMLLPERLPYVLAMEVLLTGEPIAAPKALAFGLINQVVLDGGALDGALALADKIAANGPLAVAVTKEIARKARDWPMEQAWQKQAELIGPVFISEDDREGATTFAEKRPPVWKGR